ILPFVDQQYNDPWSPQPIKLFLCPSRRDWSVGPKDDYGAGHHPDWWFGDQSWSILGGPYVRKPKGGSRIGYFGVSLAVVSNRDRSSNPLLLSHKGVAPRFYAGGSPPAFGHKRTDYTWSEGSHWEHKRDPRSFHYDANNLPMQDFMGAPHTSGMPSLFADGS